MANAPSQFLKTIDPLYQLEETELSKKHWVERRSAEWLSKKEKWITAWVHYQADVSILRSPKYLIQRAQGESPEQYEERRATSDYMPLVGTAIDSIVGRLMSAEPVDRIFQREDSRKGLGSIRESNSIARAIWFDCDGSGTNYLTMLEDLAIRICIYNEMWIYVKPYTEEGGKRVSEASVRLLDPIYIVNHRTVNGVTAEVLVRQVVDGRKSIRDKFSDVVVYTLFTLDGYSTITVTEGTGGRKNYKEEPLTPYGSNGFKFWKTKNKVEGQEQLPIFKAQLPLRRMVGYILAEKNGVIFNQESERDNILRIACTPLFVFVGNDKAFKSASENRKRGDNALQLDPQAARQHYYAAPQTEPAKLRTEVLRDKISDFFVSSFRFYEDSIRGKQKTATEIGQDAASGEGSFLNTLGATMDESEVNINWRFYQIYFPDDPDLWDQFSIQRPADYTLANPREEADKIMDHLFGTLSVPIGDKGRQNAIEQWAKIRGVDFNKEESKKELALWAKRRMIELAGGVKAAPLQLRSAEEEKPEEEKPEEEQEQQEEETQELLVTEE